MVRVLKMQASVQLHDSRLNVEGKCDALMENAQLVIWQHAQL